MSRNNPGFVLRDTNGKYVKPSVSFSSSDSASFSTSPSYYGHVPNISFDDPYSAMSQSESGGYSLNGMPHQKGSDFNLHSAYYSLRGVSNGLSGALNAAMSPSIFKSSGDYSIAKGTETISVTREVYAVDDLEEVAKIYESKGYAVSENTKQNLFSYSNNRRLYDVIQCDEMLISGITGEDIIADIKARFGNGLRLWHTTNGILNCYTYSVWFGELCIKDNTEV